MLGFRNQGTFLFEYHCGKSALNGLVTCWRLSDDKVQEDNTGGVSYQCPNDPIEVIFIISQISWSLKIEISQTLSKSGENVTPEKTDLLIFFVWEVLRFLPIFLQGFNPFAVFLEITAFYASVAETQDCKDHREKDDKDTVEQQEDS